MMYFVELYKGDNNIVLIGRSEDFHEARQLLEDGKRFLKPDYKLTLMHPNGYTLYEIKGLEQMCLYDEAFTIKEMLEETNRCFSCELECLNRGIRLLHIPRPRIVEEEGDEN